ncbi:hypothetical protein GCM10011339_33780 [Echinicola rosea]|uniref:Thioredoxin-like fold domain-containing protein n=1 Tax=Echinicola rosea TaxID=1807691 RepID=A0ABQ1V7C8_9BACT|nr:hypothetical protein GCM10011339_33780 [Echinicola rosea]
MPAGAPVVVYGELVSVDGPENVELTVMEDYLHSRPIVPNPVIMDTLPVSGEFYDGIAAEHTYKFRFKIDPIVHPGYLKLQVGDRKLLEDYLVFPGDSVKIKVDREENHILFAGPDALRYRVRRDMDLARKAVEFDRPLVFNTPKKEELLSDGDNRRVFETANREFGGKVVFVENRRETLDKLFAGIRAGWQSDPAWKVLHHYEKELSPLEFEMLKADLIGHYYLGKLAQFRKTFFSYPGDIPKAELVSLFTDHLEEIPLDEVDIEVANLSMGYLAYQLEYCITRALVTETSFNSTVRKLHSGAFKDRLMAAYVSQYYKRLPNRESALQAALEEVEASPWKERLVALTEKLGEGRKIRDVDMIGPNGKEVPLLGASGQYKLLYFWFSGCGASGKYHEEVIKELEDRDGVDLSILSISFDKDPIRWKQSIQEGIYTNKGLENLWAGAKGKSWMDFYEIRSSPYVILLSPEGEIIRFGSFGRTYGEQVGNIISAIDSHKSENTMAHR